MSRTGPNIEHYLYRVSWSEEDQEFVGTCVELPSLSWLATTPEQALAGILDLVAEVVDELLYGGEPVPEPLSTKHYSGKFNLRIGEDLHRKLATEAAERHLSLNQYVVSRLGTGRG